MHRQRKIILMMETSRTYGRSILRGIARYARTHGPWVFYRSAPFYWGANETKNSLVSLFRLHVDGIVLREQSNRRQIKRILSLGLPTIVSPYTEPFPGSPNILTDDVAIGRMAAEHLLHRGFRYFGYCGFGDCYFWSRERGRSFCRRVRQAGFETHCYEYEQPKSASRRSWEAEQDILVAWLKSLPKPAGVMACNDDRSQYILEACKLAGLRVPEEVAIIGVGNDDLICDLAAPPLSSVALSAQKAGYEAASALDALMSGQTIRDDTTVVRPNRIVTRQSTDVFAIADPYVLEVLRCIHTRAKKDALQVDDILKCVPVSRRDLYNRFSRVMSRSVHDEIKRVRMEECARLLISTELPISEIASRMGCSDAKNLARYFRQAMGMNPRAYREQHCIK